MTMLLREAIHAADTCAVEVSLPPELDEVCVRCELWGIEREEAVLKRRHKRRRSARGSTVRESRAQLPYEQK
jgi:hypothetical protein